MSNAPEPAGRPPAGWGHYLRDIIYGALDGGITTLAIVAGVAGAALGLRVAVILGLANLVADGLSMGASNYLGLKSELEQEGASVAAEMPWRHGGATFLAFLAAGAVPLVVYAAMPAARLAAAVLAAGTLFFAVGAARSRYVARSAFRCGMEMLVIGLAAAGAAYGIGLAADRLY